jgi:hypothetical protein
MDMQKGQCLVILYPDFCCKMCSKTLYDEYEEGLIGNNFYNICRSASQMDGIFSTD